MGGCMYAYRDLEAKCLRHEKFAFSDHKLRKSHAHADTDRRVQRVLTTVRSSAITVPIGVDRKGAF